MTSISTAHGLLAIAGGSPVRAKVLRYGRQSIEEDDVQAVVETLRSDWLTTGPRVAEFEEAFASYVGAKYAVSFSSGTAALHGTVSVAGLLSGDEAITSPMTFAATANCVLYQNATPVFADVAPDTLNLDPAQAELKITRRTKAIIPVDYAGHPAEMEAFSALAAKHGLVIIEDACHALGAAYRGRKTGSIADMTVFSFHPVKHLTTGEGGMVTTQDAELAEKLRRFRNHGINSDARKRQLEGTWHYEMISLGFNYRLPDLACALGLSQLKKQNASLFRRRQIAARYTAALQEIPGVIVPQVRADVVPAWHLYPIRVDPLRFTVGRAEIFRALRGENIGVNVHYIPVHFHPYYRDRFGDRGGEFPMAESAYEQLISLPIFPGMTDEDIEDVVTAVSKVAEFFGR